MEPLKTKRFENAIVLMKILDDDRMVVVDNKTTVRYVNRKSLEVLGGFKGKINHERYKNSVVAFSNNGEYFASLSSDTKESKLYNVETKKVIAKMNRHHGEVSCVGIDPKSRYMFSCGDDGKTFAIDVKSGKIAFTLPVHVDTVNDIVFSENGQWLATSSYDRKISVFNLEMMTPRHKMKIHSSPIMKVHFLTEHRVVSVDKDAKAVIFDIYSGKVLSRLNGIHDDVTQITASDDGKFLFFGTVLGYILVYDLKTYEIIARSYIKLKSKITALLFDKEDQHLIIGTDDGEILIYNIYAGTNHIKALLKNRDYDKIEDYIENNPILIYTDIYEMIEAIWQKTLAKAKLYLEVGERTKAIQLFQPFKNIPSKNQVMQKFILEYADFEKFSVLVKQERYPLAYSLANTHKLYKDSKLYQMMEARWKQDFTRARKYALDPRGADKAREILKPYRGVSEKTKFVQDLINQGEVYKRFKVSMSQKDFKLSFKLIYQHPFLREFPEYETLMNYADRLYIKSQEFIKQSDTHSAIKMLRILIDFPDFEIEAKELMNDIEIREKFFSAVEDKDIKQAYNLLAESASLQETDDGIQLQELWAVDLQIANNCAVDADITGIKKAMNKYIDISSKYMSLGTVFGWAYMIQLENAIKAKKEQHEIEEGIKNYILSFGVQDQIESFFHIFKKYYPKSKLNLDLQTKGSLKMWRPSMIVKSILD